MKVFGLKQGLGVPLREERLDLRKYCKLAIGGLGAWSPTDIFQIWGSEMPFPAFSQGIFSK